MDKRIPRLDSPRRELSFKSLNVVFALFSRSLLYTFTLLHLGLGVKCIDLETGVESQQNPSYGQHEQQIASRQQPSKPKANYANAE